MSIEMALVLMCAMCCGVGAYSIYSESFEPLSILKGDLHVLKGEIRALSDRILALERIHR